MSFPMGFFDLFRRPPPIRTAAELADFIDHHAAFLAQKGIYEYARARAGHYAKVLFKEPEFLAQCDVSRWQTFPLALAMVGELVTGILSQTQDRGRAAQAVRELVLNVYDRYPPPPMLGRGVWEAQRAELDLFLKRVSMHPVKLALDIPEPFWQRYFDLMPIHEKLRTRDELTTRGFLRVTLINVHDVLSKRLDRTALAEDLASSVLPR
jgi:hypothetical protein